MKDWERPYYENPGGNPFLFYVLYGTFKEMPALSRSKYWSNGCPDGFDLMRYDRSSQPDVLDSFCEGYLWELLRNENRELSDLVQQAEQCFILKGEIEDQRDLNYFRDVVGLLQYMSDNGGVCLYDPQAFEWWSIPRWTEKVFQYHEPNPRHHAVILYSEEIDGFWYHTRGMRKFGRPDLSMFGVTREHRASVVEMMNRFIEFQAFGGVIEEGKEIKIDGFPPGYTCHHRGSLDDPDFNNAHVEIKKVEQGHSH